LFETLPKQSHSFTQKAEETRLFFFFFFALSLEMLIGLSVFARAQKGAAASASVLRSWTRGLDGLA